VNKTTNVITGVATPPKNAALAILTALGAFAMPVWMTKVPLTEEELAAKKAEDAKPKWTENGQREIARRAKQLKAGIIKATPSFLPLAARRA
jgi:hypothetical protein